MMIAGKTRMDSSGAVRVFFSIRYFLFIRVIMNAHDYALQADGSFALPDACFKVQALMAGENSEISDFADIIGVDPSMTSRLLQIANSAIYSFPGEISNISRAITIIG